MTRITSWPAVAAAALATAALATLIVFARQTGTGVSALHAVRPHGKGLRKISDNRSFDPV